MKKILLLLALCLLLTGCSMNYTLDFDNGDIKEKIIYEFDEDIYETVKHLDGDGFYIEKELIEQEIPSLNNYEGYYHKNIDNTNKKSIVTLDYIYSYKNLINSYMINRCFENAIFVNEEDSFGFSLSGSFACFNDRDITLKISSKNKVFSNNADYYKDGYYVWNLNPEDLNHEVKFSISKTELVSKTNELKIKGINIVIIILLIMALGAYLFIKKKMSRDAI